MISGTIVAYIYGVVKTIYMKKKPSLICLVSLIVVFFACSPVFAAVEARFLYNLSDFFGTVPVAGAGLAIDYDRNETYVLYQETARVFNEAGMEVYSFSDAGTDLGIMRGLAVLPEGDLITLSFSYEGGARIVRRNYRGEPISEIKMNGLPSELSQFVPYQMRYNKGLLYFADLSLQVVVTDVNGLVKKHYDLLPLLELKPDERADNMMTGFDVDKDGDLLFTIKVLFQAFVLSPEGKLRSFGQAGSMPGKFNQASGITSDTRGNYLVADQLKGAVQIFDKGFTFLSMFGDWEGEPGTLLSPQDVAVNSKDMVYVAANRGVSVYRLSYK